MRQRVPGGRAVATPYAGLTRSTTSETLRHGQRLATGASERSPESAFHAEGRGCGAGYGYHFGDVMSVSLEASWLQARRRRA